MIARHSTLRVLTLASLLAMLGACGGPEICDDTEFYKQARNGDRIAVPDGLDEPDPGMEMAIPDAAERPEGFEVTGCLEAPPALGTD